MPILLAVTSCPSSEVAARIARTLVEERLAACVTILPGARSVYRWDGAVQEADEVVCLVKTTSERWDDLSHRFPQLHPYEVPELIALELAGGLPSYLEWVAMETS